MRVLIVTQAFGEYAVGARIEEQSAIAEALAHNAAQVVSVNEPDAPKRAKKADAAE